MPLKAALGNQTAAETEVLQEKLVEIQNKAKTVPEPKIKPEQIEIEPEGMEMEM